ncbi:hypothetical protein CHH57_01545 [Niallia circulans]|uniref:Uncharacterized protein n=1 Tax=Niallia circulans TaxID=1397 RepID=A0AA91TVV4_NIACI|nr:hypothetical protein [Niallia circulans]PAD85022.1 hypothetical protein CHH57_01545 [Niallia circulans]
MAYAMGKVEVLVGMRIDGDNEEVVLEQANYKFSPDLNIGYELYRIDYKGERHKVDICEIVGEGILDTVEE